LEVTVVTAHPAHVGMAGFVVLMTSSSTKYNYCLNSIVLAYTNLTGRGWEEV